MNYHCDSNESLLYISINLTCYGCAYKSARAHGDEEDSIGRSEVIHTDNPAADFAHYRAERSRREAEQQHEHHEVDEIRTQRAKGDGQSGRGVAEAEQQDEVDVRHATDGAQPDAPGDVRDADGRDEGRALVDREWFGFAVRHDVGEDNGLTKAI